MAPFSPRRMHTHAQINVRRHTYAWTYQRIHLYFINIHTWRHIIKHSGSQTLTDKPCRVLSLVNRGLLMCGDRQRGRHTDIHIFCLGQYCRSGLTWWQRRIQTPVVFVKCPNILLTPVKWSDTAPTLCLPPPPALFQHTAMRFWVASGLSLQSKKPVSLTAAMHHFLLSPSLTASPSRSESCRPNLI